MKIKAQIENLELREVNKEVIETLDKEITRSIIKEQEEQGLRQKVDMLSTRLFETDDEKQAILREKEAQVLFERRASQAAIRKVH